MLSICGVALAHGGADSAGDDFQAHLGVYTQDINGLLDSLDAIVADYNPDSDVLDRTDALVSQWEEVDFHQALETHAITLYPPIWVALGGFKQAVSESAPAADVQQWQQRIEAALWQGLGALKLVAARPESTGGGNGQDTPSLARNDNRTTVTIIKDNLDRVLVTYRDGETDKAKKLVRETYMQRFEGIEGDLIEQDADLVTRLEEDFNATLPLLIEKSANTDKVAAQIKTMNTDLDKAQGLLEQGEQNRGAVF